jgi:DNA-binding response OmpR family regulator
MNILLIDDDQVFCNQFEFKMSNFCKVRPVTHFIGSMDDGLKDELKGADALLIDLKMPQIDGISLYRRLKERGYSLPPTLILTENDNKDYRLMAFREGVDDFLSKDASGEEIFLRIRKAMQHSKSQDLVHGSLRLSHMNMSCQVNNQNVELTRIEFQILKLVLASSENKILKKDLVSEIWKNKKVSAHTLNTHVYNLNLKLKMWEHGISVGSNGVVHLVDRQSSPVLVPKEQIS